MIVGPPEPMPGTHLAQVDCAGCGAYTYAVPEQADNARCTACWQEYVDQLRSHECSTDRNRSASP